MSKRLAFLTAVALIALPVTARSQSANPPWDYPPTLSTTPVQVLTTNTARRRIIFFNPSATITIAFCPSQVTRPGVTFACAVNGAGSITLLPYASFVLDGGTPNGPPLAMSAAWFGVATASAPATLFEFE